MIRAATSCIDLEHGSVLPKHRLAISDSQSSPSTAFVLTIFPQAFIAVCFGYWHIFQTFADYDDEGYVMMSVQQFLRGHPLYNEVFSQYGPGYYLYKYILHLGGHVPVTHDAVRIAALGAWLVISLLCAWAAFRLTQSPALGLLIQWFAFLTVGRGICAEPGHPQELCGLLIALVFVAIVLSGSGTFRYAMALLGITLAALLLIKINIGVLLGIALLVSFLACSSKSPIRRGLWITCAAAAVVLPLAMVRAELHARSALYLTLTLAFSTVALLIAANETGSPLLKSRHWLLFTGSGCASALLISLFAVLRGTTVSMLVSGVLLQPMRRVGIFVLLLPITKFAVLGAAAGVALAVWVVLLRSKGEDSTIWSGPPVLVLTGEKTIWSGPAILLLKGVLGLIIMVCAALGQFVLLIELASPLLWLVLVTPHPQSPARRFQRIVLATVALFQILITYPIAGSQMFFAVLPTLIVAAVCLRDFAFGLPLWQSISGRMPVFTMLVAAALVAGHAIHKASDARQRYAANPPLNLPGASRLRLSAASTLRFQWLVKTLHANGGSFITLPGMNSLYFWAEQAPPTCLNMTAWMTFFNDAQQQQILNAIGNDEKLAVVYSPDLVRFWEQSSSVSSGSLVRYIQANFQTVTRYQGYEFMIRKDRATDRSVTAIPLQWRTNVDY